MTPLHTADKKQPQPGLVQARPHSAAAALSDSDLLGRVAVLARAKREATVELVAHLAELDARRLYLGQGYASLYVLYGRPASGRARGGPPLGRGAERDTARARCVRAGASAGDT